MTSTLARLRTPFALLAAVLTMSACTMSPKPEPPDQNVRGVKAHVADTDVKQDLVNGTYGIELRGGPGTIDPPGATVRITLLDSTDEPYDVVSEQDGSFSIELPLVGGEQVRLQVLGDDGWQRSDPIDLIAVNGTGQLAAASHALGDCWKLDPAASLDLDETHAVSLINDCGYDLQLKRPWARTGTTTAGSDLPAVFTLTAGERREIAIPEPQSGTFEQVLFFQTDAPQQDRRAMTIYRDTP